jgi:hypothetical protein
LSISSLLLKVCDDFLVGDSTPCSLLFFQPGNSSWNFTFASFYVVITGVYGLEVGKEIGLQRGKADSHEMQSNAFCHTPYSGTTGVPRGAELGSRRMWEGVSIHS